MTKMKRLPRLHLNGLRAFFCLVGFHVMICNVILIEADNQYSTAEQLLNSKEKELRTFVQVVEANSRNCSALVGCSSSGEGCSRLGCYKYGTLGDSNYRCLGVLNNSEFCGANCQERNFDYTQAFVKRVDTVDSHVARTVCTHRTLDDHFKNSSMNDSDHFFRVFFGAVDGTFRIYPGADEECNTNYDPRIRPWYIQSSFVPKVVTILIDSGTRMRNFATHSSQMYLDKAVVTALRLLKTLKEGIDFVNIVCFDGDGTTKAIYAAHIQYNEVQHYDNFNNSLAGVVKTLSVSTPDANHTSSAVDEAISVLSDRATPIPQDNLKVVIVLTSNSSLSELTIPANSGVNLFMYSFRNPNQAAECIPALRASSEGIPDERLDNPLYALESYLSFLAKIHREFYKDSIDYSPPYKDYTGIDTNTLTLSKAAFGASGELLGIVSIDIFETKLGEQFPNIGFQPIVEATKKKDPQYSMNFNTSRDLVTGVCFNHTDLECGPGFGTDIQSGICHLETNSDTKIGCCGGCTGKKGWGRTEWATMLGGAAAGFIGLVLVIVAVVCLAGGCVARRREAERGSAKSRTFSRHGNDKTVLPPDSRGVDFGLKAPVF